MGRLTCSTIAIMSSSINNPNMIVHVNVTELLDTLLLALGQLDKYKVVVLNNIIHVQHIIFCIETFFSEKIIISEPHVKDSISNNGNMIKKHQTAPGKALENHERRSDGL